MSSALRTGTVLGSYRIVAPLGAGGMGEVYRAHDSKLDRPVALKVLPAEVVRDAERVRRFTQEARSASSLSHPNIITIYDIGEAVPVEEGAEPEADVAKIHFIAMELVEGSTLRQIFADRSVEPRTLLSHLAQAAEGLAKAHAAGIVHRDLKPENIMVTRDGYAKVLDFGLAKLTETATSGSALGAAPTALAEEHTREGAVMGTIGYMSPEQAQGKPVDHRTDLFAFGCLLYEAATGRKPFTGESNVDVLHAIVREAPEPVEKLAPTIPRALVRKIRRCLEKDPGKRAQSMKDLAFELHDLVDEWESLATPSGTVTTGTALTGAVPPARAGVGRAGWVAIAVAVVAVAVAGYLAWGRSRAPAPAAAAFQEMTFTTATSTGDVTHASLSPDGRYLAAVRSGPGGDSLRLRQLATGSDVELLPPQGTRRLRNPVFTPDGEYVTYSLDNEERTMFTLYRMPVLGGAARQLVVDVDSPAAFSPDGRKIAFIRQGVSKHLHELIVADSDGSGETVVAARRWDDRHGFEASERGLGPVWSPDGKTLAVPGWVSGEESGTEILLVDAAGGEPRRLGEGLWRGFRGLAWQPDGRALLVSGVAKETATTIPQVWRVTVPGGEASRITNDSQTYRSLSLSADGRVLAATQVLRRATLWRRPLGGDGAPRQLTFSSQEDLGNLVGAADGSLFFDFNRGRERGVARLGPEGGEPFVLTRPGVLSAGPSVSRDGGTVLARTYQGGRVALIVMDRDGGHARELPDTGSPWDVVLHPDGTWFVQMDQQVNLVHVPVDGGAPTVLVERANGRPVGFSPEGDRLLYYSARSDGSGPLRLYLTVISARDGAPVVELDRPIGPYDKVHWAPDGKALTLRKQEGAGYNLWRLPLDGGPTTRLTDFDGIQLWDYWITPDGKTLFYTQGVETSDAVLIENFQ